LETIKGESKTFLVVELHDKSAKGDCLGYFEINLANIADLIEREEWFTFKPRKKKVNYLKH
jgi:hypothetical protein